APAGTDPDRLVEERERGLTIDLGFAWTRLPSGAELAFVDVPGHVRFIKNMLAGVGAVDACLSVVAATEGWKPQSEAHLRILQLVGEELLVVGPTMRRPQKVRVRALQSHNEYRESAGPGRRVAVNLSGLAHERPYRGDALVRPGQWFLSRRLDCALGVLATLDHDV